MRCKICTNTVQHANPKTRLRRVCGKCIKSIQKLINNTNGLINNEY